MLSRAMLPAQQGLRHPSAWEVTLLGALTGKPRQTRKAHGSCSADRCGLLTVTFLGVLPARCIVTLRARSRRFSAQAPRSVRRGGAQGIDWRAGRPLQAPQARSFAASSLDADIESLRRAVTKLSENPSLLQGEELSFLRDWVEQTQLDDLLDKFERGDSTEEVGSVPSVRTSNSEASSAWSLGSSCVPLRSAQWGGSAPSSFHYEQQTVGPTRRGSLPSSSPVSVYYPPEMRDGPTGHELPSGLRVFIATPAYGGNVTVDYMTSVVHLVTQLKEVAWQLQLVAGESIITVGRNNAVMEFLASDCTHLLFIDADVSFGVDTIRGLLAFDQDVVLAPYPAKNLNEQRMQDAAAHRGRSARLRDGLHYVLHAQADKLQNAFEAGQTIVEVDAGPTGCMLIKRGVFDRMREAYPELQCRLCGTNAGRTKRYDVWWRFFDTMVSDGEFLGEDIAFCRRWRDIGGSIWADLGATMSHVGRHAFTGSMLDSIVDP